MNSTPGTFSKRLRALMAASLTIASVVAPNLANAAVITHSVDFDILSQTRGTQPVLDFQAALPRFDSALGTLNQVDIIYRFDLDLAISIANRTLAPVSAALGPTTLRIEGPRFFERFAFSNLVSSTPLDVTLNAPAGTERTFGSITLTLPGRAIETVEVDTRFSRTSRPLKIRDIVLRPQGDVRPFVGASPMLLDFTAFTADPLALPSSGSILSGISSSTNFTLLGSVDVTYDFTAAPPVPASAPAATSLLLIGLIALGMSARRRPSGMRSAMSG